MKFVSLFIYKLFINREGTPWVWGVTLRVSKFYERCGWTKIVNGIWKEYNTTKFDVSSGCKYLYEMFPLILKNYY